MCGRSNFAQFPPCGRLCLRLGRASSRSGCSGMPDVWRSLKVPSATVELLLCPPLQSSSESQRGSLCLGACVCVLCPPLEVLMQMPAWVRRNAWCGALFPA